MRRGLCAALLLFLVISCGPSLGYAQAQPETFTWAMVGESKNWIVILYGYARRDHGHVSYAHAQPWVMWAGGGPIPRRFSVDFSVDDISCVHGTLGFEGPPGSKFSQAAPCKLVYPQSPSVPGDAPQDFIRAIRNSGRFVLRWNDHQETIQWGRAFPEGVYPQQPDSGVGNPASATGGAGLP